MCLRCIRALRGPLQPCRELTSFRGPRRNFSVRAKRPPQIDLPHPTSTIIRRVNHQRRRASAAAAQVESFGEANGSREPIGPAYKNVQNPGRRFLGPNELFHPFTSSPVPEIRRRAAFTKQHAYCPHPDHQQTRAPVSPHDPEARKTATGSAQPPAHVDFECPDCGLPVYCTEDHWADDFEAHLEICDILRQINEDDHDLRSGRVYPEFDYPGPQIEEIMVNMTNWDTFLYTREFKAINAERSMRQVTRLLTYPLTAASVLHELSPYNIRGDGRLTYEGLKSLSGMRLAWQPADLANLDSSPVHPPPSTYRRRRGNLGPSVEKPACSTFCAWCAC